jgi:hypothetical protein
MNAPTLALLLVSILAGAPVAASPAVGDTVMVFGGSERAIGGYGGLTYSYARIARNDSFVAGTEFALLVDHRLAIGLGGFGSSDDHWKNGSGGTQEMTFGYGGLTVHYGLLTGSPFQVSVGALAAGGEISLRSAGGSWQDDGVFVFEPQIEGHLNFTRWMRAGLTFGYRLVAGVDSVGKSDFAGPIAGANLQFGWF